MKIIKPSHTYLSHEEKTARQFIEQIGRICYKSTDKITDDSADKFVKNLIKRKHLAMIEHETVYAFLEPDFVKTLFYELTHILRWDTSHIRVTYHSLGREKPYAVLSTNLRVIYELYEDLKYSYHRSPNPLIEAPPGACMRLVYAALEVYFPDEYDYGRMTICNQSLDDIYDEGETPISVFYGEEKFLEAQRSTRDDSILYHHLRHSVLFTCDRGVSHELVRHRPCSFAMESTRYCNYASGKFENEITVIEPFFYEENSNNYVRWKHACLQAEEAYLKMLSDGSTPQEARSVLPNSLKTEIVMTATEEEWQHIINLRYLGTTGAPHPQMKELMGPWAEELQRITKGRVHCM